MSLGHSQRAIVLADLATRIVTLSRDRPALVAIDGVDGAGKTTLADELRPLVQAFGRPVIRASVDGLHRPRDERYRLGRASPEGFFLDSYDYPALTEGLLEPLGAGGSRRYRTEVFDVAHDEVVSEAEQVAEESTILLLDGIFLHRDELVDYWDLFIFVDVPFSVSIPRGATRGPGYGSPHVSAESNRRYIEGQRLYFQTARPRERATLIVDNTDLNHPRIGNGR